jgi:hypothetical protein
MIGTILAVLGIIIAAFALVGFGMALANRYNRIAWDKYYEGANVPANGVKQPQRTRTCAPR